MPYAAGKDASDAPKLTQTTISFSSTVRLATPTGTLSNVPCLAQTTTSSSSGMSDVSSVPSSAGGYARGKRTEKVEKDVKQPSEVLVSLRLRLVAGGTAVVSDLSLKRQLLTIPAIKTKRRKYDTSDKIQILQVAEEYGIAEALRRARNMTGYEHLRPEQISRWRKTIMTPHRRMGRPPTSDAFNKAVLSFLMFTSVEKIDSSERLRVEANIAYGYSIIRAAAQKAQKLPQFANDTDIQKKSFSNNWIKTFLKAVNCRRRRTTTTEKTLPPIEEVQNHMLQIQQELDDYEEDEIISSDETGVFYGAQPLNQYVPDDARRGVAPPSDEKARITAMLWGSAKKMGPVFLIIKCSAKGYDLTGTRVLTLLHSVDGFKTSDGWSLHTWCATIKLNVKKQLVETPVAIPYLLHEDGHVVTIQNRAWMDTIRLCMWIDVQLGPYFAKKRGRCANVWDNCGPHSTVAVQEYAENWGVRNMPLPKNMTDVLQVMDLVVNSPVKSGIRREAAAKLFDLFQQWKFERIRAERDKKELPVFAPPKPKVSDGIKMLIKVVTENLATEKFLKSLRRCFVDVGLVPYEQTETESTYRPYTEHKRGSLNPNLFPDPGPLGSLGELVAAQCGAEPVTRHDALDDLDAEEESDEESDSSGASDDEM